MILFRLTFSKLSMKAFRFFHCAAVNKLPLPGTGAFPLGINAMNIFDRKSKQLQRDRAIHLPENHVYDYVKEEIGWQIFDRICDIKRYFPVMLDLSPGKGFVAKHLLDDMVGTVMQTEISEDTLQYAFIPDAIPSDKVLIDEECIPVRSDTIDLVASSLGMHWVNNIPSSFHQVLQCLRPDGAFIGAMFGSDTLFELRVSLQLAESKILKGIAAHVSPFTTVQDLGGLLNRTGFTLLTIDVDEMVINYPNMMALLKDLKGMAENNCSYSRVRAPMRREVLEEASSIYMERYGKSEPESIPATFRIIYWIAWKPDPSQAKPAKRGSGQLSLKEIHKLGVLS